MTAHTIAISQLAVSSRSTRAHPTLQSGAEQLERKCARARAQDSASSVAFPREVAEHFFTGAATELGRSSKEEGACSVICVLSRFMAVRAAAGGRRDRGREGRRAFIHTNTARHNRTRHENAWFMAPSVVTSSDSWPSWAIVDLSFPASLDRGNAPCSGGLSADP